MSTFVVSFVSSFFVSFVSLLAFARVISIHKMIHLIKFLVRFVCSRLVVVFFLDLWSVLNVYALVQAWKLFVSQVEYAYYAPYWIDYQNERDPWPSLNGLCAKQRGILAKSCILTEYQQFEWVVALHILLLSFAIVLPHLAQL